MNKHKIFAAVVSIIAMASSVVAQGGPPPSPSFPQMPAPGQVSPGSNKPMLRKAFAIGARRMPENVVVAGKTTVYVDLPKELKEAYVIVQAADRPFTSKTRPHKVEIDFSSIPDGQVETTAKAIDEAGKEIWKGSTKVTVDNAGKIAPVPRIPGGTPSVPSGVTPPPPGGNTRPTAPGAPNAKPKGPKPPKPGAVTGELAPLPPALPTDVNDVPPVPGDPVDPGMTSPPPAGPRDPAAEDQPPVTVSQTYQSKKFGIKVQYPAGWKAADNSANIKPKQAGAFWFTFSSPEKPSKMTINFRHELLKNPLTAESYAKYNSYLQDWTQITVKSKSGFETTQGSQESSRVIHRKLIVDGKHIWRFNCIDQSGGPEFESKALLDQVANSVIK